MNQSNNPRNYNSPLLDNLLSQIPPLEMQQVQVKLQIAARINHHLQARGWSQSYFAERMGKRPSEISKWLSGTHNFTLDILVSIAWHLGIGIRELLPEPRRSVVYSINVEQKATCAEPSRHPYGRAFARGSVILHQQLKAVSNYSGYSPYNKA